MGDVPFYVQHVYWLIFLVFMLTSLPISYLVYRTSPSLYDNHYHSASGTMFVGAIFSFLFAFIIALGLHFNMSRAAYEDAEERTFEKTIHELVSLTAKTNDSVFLSLSNGGERYVYMRKSEHGVMKESISSNEVHVKEVENLDTPRYSKLKTVKVPDKYYREVWNVWDYRPVSTDYILYVPENSVSREFEVQE